MSNLPTGWIEAIDPSSGQKYYANPETGESSWRFPSAVPATKAQPAGISMGGRFVPAKPPSGDHGFVPDNTKDPKQSNVTTATETINAVKSLASNGLLIAAARTLSDAQERDNDNASDLELYSLSAGQIADLARIQQQGKEDGTFEPYVPIYPYALPETEKGAPMEEGRLDIRVHSLYDKLKKLSQ